MAGDEPGRGGLLAHQINDVFPIQITGLTQEGLFRIVVVGRVKSELPGATAVREGREGRGNVPAGKGTSAGFNIVFRVVEVLVFPYTHGEQFQQFTAVVFINCGLVALRIVQVVDHTRVGGQQQQHIFEVAHAMFTKHLDHQTHFLAAVDLAVTGAEDHVPEKCHLFLKLAGVVDHVIDPLLDVCLNGSGLIISGLIPHQQVFFNARMGLRVQQFLNGCLISASHTSFYFFAASTETSATPQVRHQGNVLVCHKSS